MTPDQLTAALDAMQQAAGDEVQLMPGLVAVNSAEWCDSLYAVEHVARILDEGIRHRGIKIVISSLFETRVLTRAEAADRGAPYLELTSGG